MSDDERRLADRLRADGWQPSPWSNGPHTTYPAHDHGYDKVLVVSAGSIVFGLPATGATIALAVGDRLDLPAGTSHDAIVGTDGVTCLEAHAPAGSLNEVAQRASVDW